MSNNTYDATILAQKVLSCIFKAGANNNVNDIIDILKGKHTFKITERKHDKLSTYGILKEISTDNLYYFLYDLAQQGYLVIHKFGQIVTLTSKSYPVLKKQTLVHIKEWPYKETEYKINIKTSTSESTLLDKLQSLRTNIANKENIPAFQIFSNKSLEDMAHYYPKNQAQLKKIPGVSSYQANKFGEKFLQTIRLYSDKYNKAAKPIKKPIQNNSMDKNKLKQIVESFKKGNTVPEIADNFRISEIEVLQKLADQNLIKLRR